MENHLQEKIKTLSKLWETKHTRTFFQISPPFSKTEIQKFPIFNIKIRFAGPNKKNRFYFILPKGYKYDAVHGVCKNEDECQYNPCQGGECIDTDGSFECSCGKYQQLDSTGRRCINQPPGTCYRIQSMRNKDRVQIIGQFLITFFFEKSIIFPEIFNWISSQKLKFCWKIKI